MSQETNRITELNASAFGTLSSAPDSTNRAYILVVDDDPSALLVIGSMIKDLGEVHFARSGSEALSLIDQRLPDVLLLDINLPDVSGLSLLRQLKDHSEWCKVPVILVTSQNDPATEREGLLAGAEDFISKDDRLHGLQIRLLRLISRLQDPVKTFNSDSVTGSSLAKALQNYAIVSEADTSGAITYANDAFCEISVYSREELIGANHRIVNSGEHSPAFWRLVWETISGGKAWRGQIRNRRKDGLFYWVDTIIAPVLGGDGLPTRYISIRFDVTERIKAKEALRVMSAAVTVSSSALAVVDQDARLVTANPAFIKLFNIPPWGLEGMPLEEVMHCKLSSFAPEGWPQSSSFKSWSGETLIRRPGGEVIPAKITLQGIRDGNGKLSHWSIDVEDHSALDSAQATIQAAQWKDALTGLGNQQYLLEQLRSYLSQRTEPSLYTLAQFDIVAFHGINTAHGFSVGDSLLRQFGLLLAQILGPTSKVSRLSGDHFMALITTPVTGQQTDEQAWRELQAETEALLKGVLPAMALVTERLDIPINVSVRIGVVHHCQLAEDVSFDLPYTIRWESPDSAMQMADLALELAVETNQNFLVFDVSSHEAALIRRQHETLLRTAISGQQLRAFLQKQVDARGEICGYETLVRWVHPEQGLIPPAMFLPAAERTGLIVDLDRWVLQTVCQLWVDSESANSNITLSVNVSALNFERSDFVAFVKEVLATTGINPTQLVLEVTESLGVHDVSNVVERMQELTSVGIEFSLDDFGTGYSSLSYLKRLPISELKIDKAFVQDMLLDPRSMALVQTILQVASNFGLRVVAEGVETQQQAEWLIEHHENVVLQGYFFGTPKDSTAILTPTVSI